MAASPEGEEVAPALEAATSGRIVAVAAMAVAVVDMMLAVSPQAVNETA